MKRARDLQFNHHPRLATAIHLLFAVAVAATTRPLDAQQTGRRVASRPEFGRVADAMLMADDRVVVLDLQDQRVWYLDAEGRTVATAGRRGAGPGEFLLTERLLRMDDSTVGVIDRRNARLTSIRVRRDTLFAIGSTPYSPTAEEACLLGGEHILAMPDVAKGHQLTRARPDGTALGTFAPITLPDGPPLLREAHLRASIGCLEERNAIVTAAAWHPVVRSFDRTGRTLWESTLPAFRPVRIEATSDGGRRFTYRPDGNSLTTRVLPNGRDTVVVLAQIFWVGPPADTATVIGARYDLDAATGRVLRVREGTERLLDMRNGMEAVMTEDPEPIVRIRRR